MILLRDIWSIERPADYKAHFAKWNGEHQPLEVLIRSDEEWQGWQEYFPGRNDFNRPLIFALARFYHEPDAWLFGGVYRVNGRLPDRYDVELTDIGASFIRRLKLKSTYGSRLVRVEFEKHYDQLEVIEILPSSTRAGRSLASTTSTCRSTSWRPSSGGLVPTGARRCRASRGSISSPTPARSGGTWDRHTATEASGRAGASTSRAVTAATSSFGSSSTSPRSPTAGRTFASRCSNTVRRAPPTRSFYPVNRSGSGSCSRISTATEARRQERSMAERFSQLSRETIGEYVYALVDPRAEGPTLERIFYVGKGTGNRCHAHARQELDGAELTESHLKLSTIREVREATGRPPPVFIVAHGLKTDEALRLEAILIATLDFRPLTNAVRGQGDRDVWLPADELDARYATPVSRLGHLRDDPVRQPERRAEPAAPIRRSRAIRTCWRIARWVSGRSRPRSASRVDLVVGVYRGLTRCAYRVEKRTGRPADVRRDAAVPPWWPVPCTFRRRTARRLAASPPADRERRGRRADRFPTTERLPARLTTRVQPRERSSSSRCRGRLHGRRAQVRTRHRPHAGGGDRRVAGVRRMADAPHRLRRPRGVGRRRLRLQERRHRGIRSRRRLRGDEAPDVASPS